MINVSQAFHRTSANPVDESMALTKAQMLTVNDNLMPAYYFTICQDDGEIYLYDKTATASAETGKFKKFESGGGSGGSGHTIVDTDGTSLTQRNKLQFKGLSVTDDSTNGATKVEGIGLNADSIDDITTITPEIPSVVIGDANNYSTSEKIIGKWIDGKPIYQRVYSISMTSNSYTTPFLPEVDNIISINFISRDSRNSYSNPYYSGSNDYSRVYVENGNLIVNLGSTYPVKPATVNIIFQYTKNTD